MREKKNELVVILRSCRQRSKISQRDLARTAKVPDSYVRELESGRVPMKKDILFRIAFALFLFKKEKKQVFSLIHEICESRRARRHRLNKVLRRCNNPDSVRLQRLASRRF